MKDQINILYVEDNTTDCKAFERLIISEKLPYKVDFITSIEQAKIYLASNKQLDIILMDYFLGDGTAFDLFGYIKDIPIVIVTGTGDEEIAVKAMKSGAYDYIIKDTIGNYLKTVSITIEKALHRKRFEDENKAYREKLETLVVERTQALELEIQERKRTQENYRILIETCPDGIFITNLEGQFINVNKAFEQISGFRENELKKMSFQEMIPNKFGDFTLKSLLEKNIIVFEAEMIKKDQTVISMEITGWAIRDEDNKVYKFGAFVKDTSQLRKNEEEKSRLINQLLQVQKMEAIGVLAAGIAHDFNNILFPIFGFTQMSMQELLPTSELYQNLEKVLIAAKRASALVKQILTFGRQTVQEKQTVDIRTIIKETLNLLRASLPSTITIRQQISKNCHSIIADPTQIHQVVMNLCTNAYHAMRKTGGMLEISLDEIKIDNDSYDVVHRKIPKGDYVRLLVRDTGHGMNNITMQRIFEPYFSTKAPNEGNGLGLSVVHGIIKRHNAFIYVESEPNVGSTFYIYFPISDGTETSKIMPPQTLKSSLLKGNENILLVDDEDQIVRMLRMLLEKLGYNVTALTSSPQTFEVFRQNPEIFDLVITDQTMPVLTGDKLATNMLKIRPNLPIILCTGFSEIISEEEAKKIGISAYVMKPVVMTELSQKIRNVLDKNKQS